MKRLSGELAQRYALRKSEALREEREIIAWLPSEVDPTDYRNWYKLVEVEGRGQVKVLIRPKPHYNSFPHYFFTKALNPYEFPTEVYPFLWETFQWDEIDLAYLESLLKDALQWGLDREGCVIAMQGGITSHWTDLPPEMRNTDALNIHYTAAYIFGGPAVSSRIRYIRDIIKGIRRHAKELGAQGAQ